MFLLPAAMPRIIPSVTADEKQIADNILRRADDPHDRHPKNEAWDHLTRYCGTKHVPTGILVHEHRSVQAFDCAIKRCRHKTARYAALERSRTLKQM